MFLRREALSPAVRSLLEHERPAPAVPAAARARAMARARATLATPQRAARLPASTPPHTIRWATAAGLVFLAGVAGGAAAYELGLRARPAVAPSNPALPVPPAARAVDRSTEVPARWRPPVPAPSRMGAGVDLARQELHLLERARAAVARNDFAAALVPLAEHARRFRDGSLAEEREALRVTALGGLGRTDEARRAIAAFERRFPRSPLLPAVSRMADTAP
jgi:hypothetical protein